MLKCVKDFGVCLVEGKKRLKTLSVFYWLNSQQFIWTLNHTTRLSIYIVDVIAIVCHLQEGEKQDDNRWKRISSPLTPHFTSTDTRPKASFQLPLTPSTLIPPPPHPVF